jgi:hypothetical protein
MSVIDFKTRKPKATAVAEAERHAIVWAIRQATGPGRLSCTTSKADAEEAAYALTILTGRPHRVTGDGPFYHIVD